VEKIWSDPHYGLRDPDNVEKWAALCEEGQKSNVFQNEIMTYFSIRHKEEMLEMKNNFCDMLASTQDLVVAACPISETGKCTYSEFAYWQWASSYFTMLPALEIMEPTVANIDDSIFGFPEISYFKTHFMEKIASSEAATKEFKDINFGNPRDPKTKFYSHLFFLPEADFRGEVPKSSLFNLETLQTMFATFEKIPDLTLTPGVDFYEFIPQLNYLTKTLELDSDYQTYMLGLWMKYAYEWTGMRTMDGGDKMKTFITQLAMESIEGVMEWMSTEFPPLLYGAVMAESNVKDCESNVKSYIREVEEKQIPAFCADPKLDMVSAESFAFYASLYMNQD
jgi:hypothetical protein